MDMYEITLNVMYTAAVLVAMFTGIIWIFRVERQAKFLAKLIGYGWILSAAVFVAASITLIWVK